MPFMPPLDKLSWEKKSSGYSGIAQCLQEFEVILFMLWLYLPI